MMKPTKTGPHEVDPENVQPITKDQLKVSDKAELEAYMKHYEELCLTAYGQTKMVFSRRIFCQHRSKSPSQPILKDFKT
jgi:hypothetical protein